MSSRCRSPRFLPCLALAFLFGSAAGPAVADTSYQTLPFSQNWSNAGLITVNDSWSGVPGITGYLGDDTSTSVAPYNPQTYLIVGTTVDVIANQATPNTNTTGGVAEFAITDPVVALQGSGTADAPHVTLYLNTTGQTNVTVHYNLRDIDGSADNAVQAVSLQYRNAALAGNFTDVAAAFVADASTGPSLATLVTPVCAVVNAIDNLAQAEVRIVTGNATGSDEWIGVDDIVVDTAGCAPAAPNLVIGDVSQVETDSLTTTFTFAVTLSAPAGAGGVTFDIATADGTAQDDNPVGDDEDYVAQALTGQSIPMGSSGPYNFVVTVNGDTEVEANETFFVNVTNVVGANNPDGQGLGTITNDDLTLTPIHDIQGPGASSPLSGSSVTTRGIVTGVKSNGFFLQEPDASVDADPATSEGILVFTSSAPPAAAAVGNFVQVTGTVSEFVPTADPLQPPLTELTSPSVSQLSTGNPLPAAIPLTVTFPDPAGTHDQLERLEGMRVSVASLTVGGPTLGSNSEANATASSTGVFYGVVTGIARPFREAGIPAPDPAPSGSIPPIPRFDSNPERIRVDSDSIGGALVDVGAGAVVTGLIGPLDYSFRTYTIAPDASVILGVAGGPTATAVADPLAAEFTVAAYNLERFYDDVNDAGGDVVLTTTAYNNRLVKASAGIRNSLKTPDILGIVEIENLATLQDLAAQISADAIAASAPDPEYDAYLIEGNDVGLIDVGFLVKTAPVQGATPRVTVNEVVQENAGELFVNPDLTTSLLNDRPSLRLDAIVNDANGATFPLTVIVNHLRSLNDANSIDPGTNGWATDGDRVRAKRQKQAESLADLVQARQTADATERIVLIGDFNAFEFNDGLGDSMGVISGTPSPDNETAVAGDGVDLVEPDLDNLFDTVPAAEQYSFIFDGNAQSLDHVVINEPMGDDTTFRVEHPRINADFPGTARNDYTPGNPVRLADHDPIVAYFRVTSFGTGNYFTLAPCRAVDTRTGSPLQDGVPQTFGLHGVCGIPVTATSVVLNLTAVGPTGDGDLTIYATDTAPPGFATMPFPAGVTRGLFATVLLSNDVDGEVTVLPSVAGSGNVHLLLDVMGYFE